MLRLTWFACKRAYDRANDFTKQQHLRDQTIDENELGLWGLQAGEGFQGLGPPTVCSQLHCHN